jgi:ribosome-binding protein aMBF1 (putative translation factor)
VSLRFRNVDADPTDPVETWPYEALATAIERGSAHDWARITAAIRADPWGRVARATETYLGYADRSGATELLRRAIDRSRGAADAADRSAVAARVRELIARSGLTAAQFANRIGTSASRLSTYASGKVVPSAALLLRMERASALLPARSSDALTGRKTPVS